jgi:hypothetical protein
MEDYLIENVLDTPEPVFNVLQGDPPYNPVYLIAVFQQKFC